MTGSLVLMLVMVVVAAVGRGVMGEAYSGKVLLVSMDGFRWDYVKQSGLKHFPEMARSGCSVDYVNNTFATFTFPCHYTIVTGLYEESHGIVANRMYDRRHNATFSMASKESFWWEGGEPIWITAEKQKRNSSAVMFWPGSESVIQGLRPSIYKAYQKSLPFDQRVRTAISWFSHPYNKDFVALYFDEPDGEGHKYGPNSPQVAAKVKEMDGVLGKIMSELASNHLTDVVNVIVTSDHGMTDIEVPGKLIDLWQYVNKSLVDKVPDSEAVTAILPKPGQEAEVLRQARNIPHTTVYRREDIPDHFHYRENPDRIMPIIVISEEGWTVSSITRDENGTFKDLNDTLSWIPKGNHGYSNELPSMKPIFFARGPNFRKGVKSTSICSVDIYPLLCRLLNIRASPNNGSEASTAHFLQRGPSSSAGPSRPPLMQSAIITTLLCLLVAVCCCLL